jgi:hypothetical protein
VQLLRDEPVQERRRADAVAEQAVSSAPIGDCDRGSAQQALPVEKAIAIEPDARLCRYGRW